MLLAFGAAGTLAQVVYALASGGHYSPVTGHWLYDAVLLAAALVCATRAVKVPARRAVWVLMTLALMSWLAGDWYWDTSLADESSPPFPSWADAGYLAFYPLCAAALIMSIRKDIPKLRRIVAIDVGIGAMGAAALAAAFVFPAVVEGTGGSAVTVATNLAYPVGDLVLLLLLPVLMALGGRRLRRGLAFVTAGLLAFAAADIVFLIQTAEGTYSEGTALDALWLIGPVLIAAGAWQPDRGAGTSRAASSAAWWVTAPVIYGLGATAVELYDHFHRVNLTANLLAGATLIAVVVRLVMTVGENRVLMASARRQALNDALTGLRNRRRLATDLDAVVESATADRPVLFGIFDLDGFKNYNDTFGHAAGDALLRRLGRKLEEAIGERSRTYRLGGDEFCVLTRPGDADPASSLTAAVEALRERGDVFAVTSSHGHVWIPEEATTASEALRLADQRMYAQKGLASGGSRPPDA